MTGGDGGPISPGFGMAQSVDDVYAAVRDAAGPASAVGAELALQQVAACARALALRTPTLPPATHTSCFVLGPSAGTGGLLAVDPGTPYADDQERLLACLEAEAAAGRTLGAVVLTHHHGDHIGAADALRQRFGVPVVAHPLTAARLEGVLAIDQLVDDGDELTSGPTAWRVLATPGHAPGHVCLHAPDGTMVVGDMAAGIGTILIDPIDGDMRAYLASLARLAALQPTRLLPAHGPMIDDAVARLHGLVAHRLGREAKVVAALRAAGPATVAQLTPHAYADTPTALWPLAERSMVSHLRKLVADGVAIAEGAPVDGAPRFRLL